MFSIASPNQAVPYLLLVFDRDDASALSVATDYYQYENVMQVPGTYAIDLDLVPSITPAYYAGGAFTGYGVEPSTMHWIDIANTGVQHYGIKFFVPGLQATSTSSWSWDVMAWYTVSFKNSR